MVAQDSTRVIVSSLAADLSPSQAWDLLAHFVYNHDGLIRMCSRVWFRMASERSTWATPDDLLQMGRLGMLKAAMRWDGHGPLVAWCMPWIRGTVSSQMAYYGYKQRNDRLYSWFNARPLSDVAPEDMPLEAACESNEDAAADRLDLFRVMPVLDAEEAAIIDRLYGRGDTLDDVGRDLGMTLQGVAYIRKRALRRLRECMDSAYRAERKREAREKRERWLASMANVYERRKRVGPLRDWQGALDEYFAGKGSMEDVADKFGLSRGRLSAVASGKLYPHLRRPENAATLLNELPRMWKARAIEAWHNSEGRSRKQVCPECGREFVRRNQRQRTCSRKCAYATPVHAEQPA